MAAGTDEGGGSGAQIIPLGKLEESPETSNLVFLASDKSSYMMYRRHLYKNYSTV